MEAADLVKRFELLKAKALELDRAIGQLESRGMDPAHQRVALRILKDFVGYGLEDLSHGEAARAKAIAEELSQIVVDAKSQLEAFLSGRAVPPFVPKFRTYKVQVCEGQFRATRTWPNGKVEISTVIFTGYGHFGQVRKDLPKFDEYGVNLIQIEIGPSSTVVGPDETDTTALDELLGALDRAAEHNVSVCLLLSPHYFPGWALRKHPQLSRCEGGFIRFCVDAPEAREVVSRHIRTVISKVRHKAALHSVCLTNEPIYRTCSEDEHTRSLWAAHLATRFSGSLDNATDKLRTSATGFEDFPIPDWRCVQPTPLYYEWCVFNQERFANWHRWMGSKVHEIAPEIAVHAKIMPTIFDRTSIANGVDPFLFCQLSQINGNDCWCIYRHQNGGYAQEWLTQNMFYDLLRSFAERPIFNSENHLIKDREKATIPWQHIRSALWQGAVHGQCATTIWVWERTYDQASDFAGSIMHRPLCVRAVGETSLDLMRFSEEITALQLAAPEVGLLYSIAAIVYEDDYLPELRNAYEALNFTGRRISFHQGGSLSSGPKVPPVLLVTNASHIEVETARRIGRFLKEGGRLIIVGQGPQRDQYDSELPSSLLSTFARATMVEAGLDPRELRAVLLGHLGAPRIYPADSDGRMAWGVEWLDVHLKGRWLLNAVNLLRRDLIVRWTLPDAKSPRLTNLFSGQKHEGNMVLKPMEPVLAQVGEWDR